MSAFWHAQAIDAGGTVDDVMFDRFLRALWGRGREFYPLAPAPTYLDVRERLRREEPGTWRETVRWPHEEVEHDGHVVPAYLVGDPERVAWRRRKWWGRHVLEVDAIGQWYRWWPW
jgi:hypothetical protein